jgi:metallo-beta-lactamase class B
MMSRLNRIAGLAIAAVLVAASAGTTQAQGQATPDHPAVTVNGRTYTPASILARNMGTEEDQTTQFPPHKIIGNVYYVGTRTLSSFLVVTAQGNILIDSTYERNVPTIRKSVEQLGFRFADTRILLGNHAHGDHQEGDALVKQLTGAQVMAMAEDVPALQALKPAGKEHPIDRVLHDGDKVTLGDATLVAHLTAGHTRGCTTWTMKAQEGGRTYDVVFGCSLRPPGVLTPAIVDEFNRTFKLMHALPCDVQLGDHGAQYDMQEKFAALQKGGRNPFIEPATCKVETDVQEAMFHAILAEQRKAARHVTIPFLASATRLTDLAFEGGECEIDQRGNTMACQFQQVFFTMSDAAPQTCLVTTNRYARTFTKQGDMRWVSHEAPAGVCGVVEETTLRDGGGVKWTMETRKQVTRRDAAPLCRGMDEQLDTLSWQDIRRPLPCAFIQPGGITP